MASRNDRARNRVITRLCLSSGLRDGFGGEPRSELARCADSNNYRRGLADIDRMLADGDIEPNPDNPKKLRLTLRTIDEVAYSEDASLVSNFFNLDKPYARRLRLQRIATNGDDVLLPPAGVEGEPKFPRYNTDPWYGLKPQEVLDATETRDKLDFWGTGEIPAWEVGRVLVPGQLAEIEVPAQPFAWTPQVHTTGPHNVAVMVRDPRPADADGFDELLDEPRASESFWA